MKFLTHLLLACLLAGCSTTVRGKDGKVRFRTYANANFVSYEDGETKLVIQQLDHSTPTAAGGKAATGVIGNVGTILLGGGAGTFIK